MSVEEIAQELGVDSLGYLSLEGMTQAVAEQGPFCAACFSGDYQAPLVDPELAEMAGLTAVSPGPRT